MNDQAWMTGPPSRLLLATDLSARCDRALDRAAQLAGECARFLAASDLPDEARSRLRVVIEQGALETSLTRYVREQGVDLVVMGTHGRSGLMNILLGSAAARLLDWLPCDTLIVRAPRATA